MRRGWGVKGGGLGGLLTPPAKSELLRAHHHLSGTLGPERNQLCIFYGDKVLWNVFVKLIGL